MKCWLWFAALVLAASLGCSSAEPEVPDKPAGQPTVGAEQNSETAPPVEQPPTQ